MKKSSNFSKAFVIVAGVIALAILIVAVAHRLYIACPQVPFDSTLWKAAEANPTPDNLYLRKTMVADLINNVLPGMKQHETEVLLGNSPSHAEFRRHSSTDLVVREKDENGSWKPFPKTGKGYYYDEYEWEHIYSLGKERVLIADHRGTIGSPDDEMFLLRFDKNGRFSSWYIVGSSSWPNVVGASGSSIYSERRSQ